MSYQPRLDDLIGTQYVGRGADAWVTGRTFDMPASYGGCLCDGGLTSGGRPYMTHEKIHKRKRGGDLELWAPPSSMMWPQSLGQRNNRRTPYELWKPYQSEFRSGHFYDESLPPAVSPDVGQAGNMAAYLDLSLRSAERSKKDAPRGDQPEEGEPIAFGAGYYRGGSTRGDTSHTSTSTKARTTGNITVTTTGPGSSRVNIRKGRGMYGGMVPLNNVYTDMTGQQLQLTGHGSRYMGAYPGGTHPNLEGDSGYDMRTPLMWKREDNIGLTGLHRMSNNAWTEAAYETAWL